MKYIEEAEALLMQRGFTLAEADATRQVIQKRFAERTDSFRKNFLAKGGTATEWALIKVTFRTKPRSFLLNYPAVSQETLDQMPKCVNTFWFNLANLMKHIEESYKYSDEFRFVYSNTRTQI